MALTDSTHSVLLVFEFLTARELGVVAPVCREFRVCAADPFLWKWLFSQAWLGNALGHRVRRDANGLETDDELASIEGQRFKQRPRGLDAVGWTVQVFNEDSGVWDDGEVIDARIDEQRGLLWMQVRYSTPIGVHERWEVDQRHTGPWHARGKTRFRFLQPPVGSAAEALLAAENDEEEGPLDSDGNVFSGADTSSAAECLDRLDSLPWRSEYRRLVLSLPAREIAVLTDHSDEVLDLQWSPDGKFLATCSRDFTTIVYDVVWVPSNRADSNGSEQTHGNSNSSSSSPRMASGPRGEIDAAATVAAASATAANAMAPFLSNHHSSNESISPPREEDLEAAIEAMRAAEEAIHEAAAAFHDQEDAQATRVHLPPERRGTGQNQRAEEGGHDEESAAAPGGGGGQKFGAANGHLKLSMRFLLRRPQGSACVCRLNFSPDSAFLLCCTEEPHGNPFSPESCVEVWRVQDSVLCGIFPSTPFDVHAHWLPPSSSHGGGSHAFLTGMGVEPLEVFNDSDSSEEDGEEDDETSAARRRRRQRPKPVAVQRIGVWKLRKGAAHPKRRRDDKVVNSRDASAHDSSMHEDATEPPEGVTRQSLSGALQSSLRNLRDHVNSLLPATSQASLDDGSSSGGGRCTHEGTDDDSGENYVMSGFGGLPDDNSDIENDDDSSSESTSDAPFATLEVVFYHTNFAHLAQVSPLSGNVLVFASGNNPWLVHQVHIVRNLCTRLASRDAVYRVRVAPPPRAGRDGNGEAEEQEGEGGTNTTAAGGGILPSSHRWLDLWEQSLEDLEPPLECGGVILSLRISGDERYLFVNVRPFVEPDRALSTDALDARLVAAPEIESSVELQVWDLETRQRVSTLRGHHAFTTKDCPFLLFTQDDTASPLHHPDSHALASTTSRGAHETVTTPSEGHSHPAVDNNFIPGDLISSGSEDASAYVWSLKLKRLVKVLRGHQEVVSAVSWSPIVPGLLATASDDYTVRLWGRINTEVHMA